MKLYELQAVAKRLNDFKFISRARRVENNTIEITFDRDASYFFNMTRGHSHIYKAQSKRPIQGYNAPFDTLLHSLLSASRVVSIEIPDSDRVLRLAIAPKSSYKDKIVYLQLEFTGKNTNAILIDENEVIIEALRHIDADSSFRVVRPGIELLPIPPLKRDEVESEASISPFDKTKASISDESHKRSDIEIDDVDIYLEDIYQKVEERRVSDQKRQKLISVAKKSKKLEQLLDRLPNRDTLLEEEKLYKNYGNIILANLYNIKPYDRKLETYDFDGNPVTIKFPKNIKPNRLSDYFFNLSKRAKNKAINIHIEKENLVSKKRFYDNIYYALQRATSSHEIELLVPKNAKSQKRKEKLKEGELFWIEDYKVFVGRNSSENQKLLSIAKANDLWMHIRGVRSSHVIIRTDKQNLPMSVIESAAKLCVDFSVKNAGEYEVDYTKRKFVKVQEGSSVLYNKYDTIRVRKEGIEIRE
ncbi:Fibronectin/fibrinogen-binding protein [hydrothermal vent metagenome]|uniref:Fibronectin/fibrinogen-binding protein n=1 Tax=hydrothermal vent metagenome TaxID=652676 RepID=A0A1W1BV81_9ZZZZ